MITLKHSEEVALGAHGGAELFFADIDGDGQPEILAYQGPGIFGTKMYHDMPQVAAAYPKSTCLSAFKKDGTRMWTFGEVNPTDKPYLCHAHESCVATGDVDGDGVVEVALADGDTIHLLDGPTGKPKGKTTLAEDNFFIVQILGEPTGDGEAALVVKNGEGGYGDWRYGEPLVGIDKSMKIAIDPVAIPGAGHHIMVLDLDNDGKKEYLCGYCMVKPSGEWTCIPDAIEPDNVDAGHEHVDYTDILYFAPDTFAIGFAGSNRGYLVMNDGRTLFSDPDTHVQGSVLGRFREDSEYQLAIYNDDGPMVLYDPEGNELWRLPTEETWPLGMPKAAEGHVFHRNRPVIRLSVSGDTIGGSGSGIGSEGKSRERGADHMRGPVSCPRTDYILFTDGGWPWAMDGEGKVAVEFEPPANSKQPEMEIPEKARADDMGYGFATKTVDWNGDGNLKAVIYDRRYLWVFPLEG